MAATALSTLVLALEARNNTAAAFGETSTALGDLVAQARSAADELAAIARSTADAQLQATRAGLVEQTAATRQAVAEQVAAVTAGADRQAAVLQAARARADALRGAAGLAEVPVAVGAAGPPEASPLAMPAVAPATLAALADAQLAAVEAAEAQLLAVGDDASAARRVASTATPAYEDSLQHIRDHIVATAPVGSSIPVSTVAREAFAGDRAAAEAALDELAARGVVRPPVNAPGFYEVLPGHGTQGPGGAAPPPADIRQAAPLAVDVAPPADALAATTAAVARSQAEQTTLVDAGAQERQAALRSAAEADAALIRAGQEQQVLAVRDGGAQQQAAHRTSLDSQLAALRDASAAQLEASRSGAEQRLGALRAELAERLEALRAGAEEESTAQRSGLLSRIPVVGPALAALAPAPAAQKASPAEHMAALRAATAEQVTLLRAGATEQLTVVRSAATEQLAAVKDGLAQQVLVQRQAMEQQVAAIKAGADQQAATLRAAAGGANAQQQALADQLIAQVRADQDAQTLAVRQAYEQQVLAARQAADASALAVKAALTSQLDTIKASLAQQVDAQKAASAANIATVRDEAAREAAARRAEAAEAASPGRESAQRAREHPLLSRVPVIGGALGGVAERAEGPLDLLKEGIGISAGMAAISAFVEGIHEIPKAFAEAATEGEQFQVQMTNFYGTMDNAGKVLEYTNEQAGKMPFSLEAIRGAVAGLSETGQNVQQLLPALGNIAAAMHTDLPDAVSAFNRALLTGNMRGLVSQLHLSKTELEAFGLEVTSKGSVVTSTLAPALERLAAAKFGDAMAKQSETAQGGLTRLHNAWDLFKETAGEGLFDGLKGTLKTIGDWLQTHQGAVQAFAAGLGHALAGAAQAALGFAQTFGPPILAAINLVVAAWNVASPAIQGAINVIKGAMQTIGTFMQTNVLPAIEQALGQIITWWQQNKDQIGAVLNAIMGAIGVFVGTLQQNLAVGLNVLQGIWNVGWGLMSGSFSVVLDVMTGNWKKFSDDLNNMAVMLDVGILKIFQGMVDKSIEIISHLADPINQLEHALYNATKPFADELYGLSVLVEVAFIDMVNKAIKMLDWLDDKLVNNPVFNWMGLKKSAAPIPLLQMPTATQIRSDEQNWINTLSLGFRPDVNLTLGRSQQQAQSDFDKEVNAWIDQLTHSRNLFTGAASTFDTGHGAAATGKTFLDQINDWIKKNGIKLPGLGEPGKPITMPDLQGGAGAGGSSAPGTTQAQKDALRDAENAFALLLEKGPVTWAAGMKDIGDIATAAKAAGQSGPEVLLTVLRDTKELVNSLLGQAQKQFDFDAGVAHPSLKTLHQDENSYLAILAKTPGITPLDLKEARQQMDQRIAQVIQKKDGTPAQQVAPYKQSGADLLAGAGYGQTVVGMGPMRDALLEQMRLQLARQDRQIVTLEKQLEAQREENHHLLAIEKNTAGTHEAARQTAQHSEQAAEHAALAAGHAARTAQSSHETAQHARQTAANTKPGPRSGAHSFSQRTGVHGPF